jgi:predicted dehydrogenase
MSRLRLPAWVLCTTLTAAGVLAAATAGAQDSCAAAEGDCTMAQQQVRVGIIGAGANTKSRHIPGLQAISGVEIVSVANRSPESTAAVADEFGIPKRPATWQELVADPELDAVVIGTWPYMHKTMVITALEAGKHVMTEARMAMDASEAKDMLAAAQKHPGQVTQIVPSPMTLQYDATIQRLVREGALGQLLRVDVRGCTGAALDESKPLHWRQMAEFSGLNIMTLGIFYEAVRRWVGDATEVMAMGKTHVKARVDPATGAQHHLKIPDHIDVLGTLPSGAQLHLLVSDVLVGKGRPAAEFWIYGSEADLHYTLGPGGGLTICKHGADPEPVTPDNGVGGAWRVEEEFVSVIRGQEKISHTRFEDGVCYMEFTEAVWKSMQGAGAVQLPLI